MFSCERSDAARNLWDSDSETKMQSARQRKVPAEPRWVTRVLRLFPHPIFAGIVAFACLLVAAIFMMVACTGGPPLLALVSIGFGAGASCIVSASISRRRRRMRHATFADEEWGTQCITHSGLDSLDRDMVLTDVDQQSGAPPVSTKHLLLYLATVMVWELKIIVFLLGVFAGVPVAPLWRHSLTACYIVLTLLALRFGWRDLQRLKRSGGQVELTRGQSVLVTSIFVACGVGGAVVFQMLRGKL